MKFYSRDKVYRQIQEIKAAGYRSVPVPPLVGDLVLVPVLAFGTLYGCYFGKSVFGLYARMAYNFLEFEIHKFVIALLIAILLHPLIRSSLYPGTIFSSHSSIGLFGVFPPFHRSARRTGTGHFGPVIAVSFSHAGLSDTAEGSVGLEGQVGGL